MTRAATLLALFSTTVFAQESQLPQDRSPPAPRQLSRKDPNRFVYEGDQVPEGYRLVTRPRWWLVGGGALLFLGTAAAHGFPQLGNDLYRIPLAGPVIAIADAFSGRLDRISRVFAPIVFGTFLAAEIAGLTLLIVGTASPARWLERNGSARPQLTIVPGAAGAPMGASLVGRF